jgi:tetratricopeptide (TPR) repeat protein
MEMSPGNQLIPFTKACLLIANGEFDKAKQVLFLIKFFSEDATLPEAYRKELGTKLDLLSQGLADAINKGIALHDKGEYRDAVAHYEELLKSFPKSAWLNYEYFYSKTEGMKNQEESLKEWSKWKPVIYACDPMYHMNVQAQSGKEGYLLFRRQEGNSLFQSKENLKKDFVQYADIAFDLENYGLAAQMYWLMVTHFSEDEYGKRNILAYYLYCLDQLGEKETVKNFKGDFPKEFSKITSERKKIMEKSSIYKAFEKKE